MKDLQTEAIPTAASAKQPDRTSWVLMWIGAGVLYALVCSGAIALTPGWGYGKALLFGFANTLPDFLAAPLVFRVAGRAAAQKERAVRRLLPTAIAFLVWSVLGASGALVLARGVAEGVWTFTMDSRSLIWKTMMALLEFGVLAGVGMARALSQEARDASARALRAEALRSESRLQALRAQLHPHFILNVLHSLVGLAERDPKTTSAALERLGTALRYALRIEGRGRDWVLLRDELAFTREYLELERLRLGERLTTRFFIDETQLSRTVPPFVLQPLVENAIVHAIAPRSQGGVLSIHVEETLAWLLLSVEDNGSAVAPGDETKKTNGSGLGLKLLRDRLEVLYRGAASLTLDRSPMGGFRARLRLPGEPPIHEEVAAA